MDDDQLDLEQICSSQRSHFEHKDEFMNLVAIITSESPEQEITNALHRIRDILDLYQEQPHLLDHTLEDMIQPVMISLRKKMDAPDELNQNIIMLYRFLYLLTKTRGYKTIIKFMSHEVTDLEPVFEFLSKLDSTKTDQWEVRYICFIWLSLICMIPFDLKRITQDSLIVRIFELCKRYLRSTGKERDGASLLVARLLARQDICYEYLIPYIVWAKERLSSDADVFETAGILQSLCITYQLAPREVLLDTLDDGIVPLLTMPFFDQYENNALVRKLRTKLTQRVGLCYLRPKIASWRYQRGYRSLRQNLESTQSDNIEHTANDLSDNNNDDDEEDISDHLELIIEILLNGLRDKDTIVRWSAAKGIGRITQRLPQELAEDVVGSLLELFEENTLWNKNNELDLSAVSDHTWHGASLAIAELARRGLLLPARLQETIPWILRGLKFDIKRGSHSIGAHVRDACCYVCWAFARAYAPHIMKPYVKEIAQNLVVVSVFDREINVRRASSAAFQENVGRQGIFPHGIDIIQVADYFSLGNRNTAFLNIACVIAKFDEYRYHLIQHLISVTAKHWDKSMRVLASKALSNLVSLDPNYFLTHALPYLVPNATSNDLQVSHGAMLAIAEISLALYETSNSEIISLYQDNTSILAPIVSNLPPRSLTTFGSEHVREAVCHLITCLSKTHLEATHVLSDWKRVIHSSLERKEESVQAYAVLAFGAVAEAYGITEEEVDEAISKIDTANPNYYSRRGYTLALGTIDYNKYKSWLHKVVIQLCKASQVQENPIANDAEAKRNAVIGLNSIFCKLGVNLKAGLSYDDFQYVLDTLERCFSDYSTDQRGDVGSWVRTATMELIGYLLPCISKLDHDSQAYLSMEHTSKLVASLLKQSVERIDKVRSNAGKVIYDLIFCNEYFKCPGKDVLRHYIKQDLSWSSPSDLYPVMVQLLKIPEYRFDLLTGLISSAGGLTESLVRYSSSCLIEYMDLLPVSHSEFILSDIFNILLDIFVKYEKQDRVTMPLLDVLGLLYESGTLTKIEQENLHLKLFTLVRKEVFKCRNIRKLLSAVKLFIGLMSVNNSQVKTKTLQQLLTYLVHSFPRIRIEVSEQLFTQISFYDDDDEKVMEVLHILTETNWAGPLNDIKEERDKLYSLLDIPKPILVKRK
ncbi:armadillo-type protein [Cokeromyces recurvatus]|uniref:armadillo-type protein n=1 Tax=Cokeromyces recurvatus TaxID=90255 RepID=UPI00221E6D76|nr:armadillo-type protein [Cokeromyces recurvatus]KAI7897840.1 armadillo-type protein [Cokeromyces recurvatus]